MSARIVCTYTAEMCTYIIYNTLSSSYIVKRVKYQQICVFEISILQYIDYLCIKDTSSRVYRHNAQGSIYYNIAS